VSAMSLSEAGRVSPAAAVAIVQLAHEKDIQEPRRGGRNRIRVFPLNDTDPWMRWVAQSQPVGPGRKRMLGASATAHELSPVIITDEKIRKSSAKHARNR